ncbi:MBOAT family O-acyltransferase [Aquicoccus sp. G2-2]|uniref:MBOAT family O-acyltransferase n=1 Tax=Aquicoccus sp. G2-2 TaxID=3092120 RepID=UPI002ADF742C|nr:MBOAT family O-acyltransferase [Aquicoccus sp. G2-2]MEA1114601.1 MBOAT family O-acyltransferase [Aquicoccus sp. G2-2]
MLFNSYTFIFLFLPVVWGVYRALRGRSNNSGILVLTLASLFFYGYWDIRFVPLLLLSVAVNYAISLQMHNTASSGRQRFWLLAGIMFNLGLLGFFKYTNFFSQVVESVTGTALINFQIVLPIGISFFTFQQITHLVDVRSGNAPRYSPLHYALFVSFFPQLIAGPIVHHSEMMPQFERTRRPTWTFVAAGLSLFIAGLFKKLVLADNVAPYAAAVFAAADAGQDVSFAESWAALTAFSVQIYFDFSGYCDMAVGLGLMFGIRLPINFDSPYRSRSVIEFWQRWHITLGRFLRTYIFLPVGGSSGGELKTLRNMMMVFLISGLWHGAGWGFVLWGAVMGVFVSWNFLTARLRTRMGLNGRAWLPLPVAIFFTFLTITLSWALFRAVTVAGGGTMIAAALGLHGLTLPASFEPYFGGFVDVIHAVGFRFAGPGHVPIGEWARVGVPMTVVGLFIIWTMPNTNRLFLSQAPMRGDPPAFRLSWRPNAAALTLTAATFTAALIFASTISEFLYFHF